MTQPTHIRAHDPEDAGLTVANVEQHVFRAHALDKVEMLARILQAQGRGQTMVFCRTKRTAQKVADELALRGFASGAVHGDLGQGAREQALRAFRNGKVDVLVATDVAARGIDVEGVTHVVNYQCPEDEKTYLHRIGRTGSRRRVGHCRHLRRLGRHPAVDPDQQGSRSRLREPGGDVLDLRPLLRGPRHPAPRRGRAAQVGAHPRWARSRGRRGPRRDRQGPRPWRRRSAAQRLPLREELAGAREQATSRTDPLGSASAHEERNAGHRDHRGEQRRRPAAHDRR